MATTNFRRLKNGPAQGLANTIANLPAAPFKGLRLGDSIVVLGPTPAVYRLMPKKTVTTVAATAGTTNNVYARGNWEWVNVTAPRQYTVAALPVAGVAGEGMLAYATNGRKVGEGGGAGTGVPVYFSNAAWRVYATDAAVLA